MRSPSRLAPWHVASLLLATLFWVGHALPPSVWTLAAKTGAILALAAWCWPHTQGLSRLIPLALLAHATGDALLEWARVQRQDWLIPAVAAFLVGHLINLRLFCAWRQPRWLNPALAGFTLLLALLAGTLVLRGLWLSQPVLLRVIVPIYMSVLLAMALIAQRTGNVTIALGALSYLVSDALIGLTHFAGWFPGFESGWLTWPSYYIGQWALVTGLLHVLRKQD
ncbi:lysoplasmalogenase family protein [Leeia sp.]|uniref:lysoplasmalogenase family protein n=1 Tax=Leeia sp. TaxID=2884678 RepID=UPI0035B41C68